MSLARTFLLASSTPKRRAFVRDCRDPEAAQARIWRSTWEEIAASPFWRAKMGAPSSRGAVPDLGAFPITTYDDYREALDRSYEQKRSELSGSEILFWSESAGSTGPRKVFPLTEHYRRQFQTTTPPMLNALARRYPGFLSAPALYFAGSMPKERSPAGVEVGFISNFNYRNVPPFLRKLYAFPVEALADGDTFFEHGPLYALATDLSYIVGITPAILVRFFDGMWARREALLRVLRGERSVPAGLPPLRVAPDRLALLERELARDTPHLERLWPSLAVVTCWKASTCGMQIPSLARLFHDAVPISDATYSATEGWVNVPYADGRVGGAIHPGAHVFELLPWGDEAKPESLIPIWEAEPGRDYEIFVTTSMGMVRYRLHDVVRVTARFHRSPVIHFSHKGGNEISLGPACVSEAELALALEKAGLPADTARLVAPAASGRHLEVIVAGGAPDIASAIERELERVNPMYAKYVGQGSLEPITVREVDPDHPAFHRGEMHAQQKPRLLLQDPVD
jgi:hypothetical protein